MTIKQNLFQSTKQTFSSRGAESEVVPAERRVEPLRV